MCCGHKRSALRSGANHRPFRIPQGTTLSQHQTEPLLTVPLSAVPTEPPSARYEKGGTILPAVNRPATPIATQHFSVNLRYLQASPIRVRGSVSGRQYEFSAAHPVQAIDARDATPLLQSRLFRHIK